MYSKNLTSLSQCYDVLREKVDSLKMCYTFFKDKLPELNDLFVYLKLIYDLDTKNIATSKLLLLLEKHGTAFCSFCDSQISYFSDICAAEFNEILSSSEIEKVFEQVSSGQFNVRYETYKQNVRNIFSQYAKTKKLNELCNAWKVLTKTNSPKEWSDNNSLPLIFMFEKDAVNVRRYFSIINSKRSDFPVDVFDEALNFLNESKMVKDLTDIDLCNKKFVEVFAADYAHIITNIDNLKTRLKKALPNIPYDWAENTTALFNQIKIYATEIYKTMNEKAKARIERMPEKEAKKYLLELIENDPIVGIKLLKE